MVCGNCSENQTIPILVHSRVLIRSNSFTFDNLLNAFLSSFPTAAFDFDELCFFAVSEVYPSYLFGVLVLHRRHEEEVFLGGGGRPCSPLRVFVLRVQVYLSLKLLERDRLALEFLGYISKAATALFSEQRALKETPKEDYNNRIKVHTPE